MNKTSDLLNNNEKNLDNINVKKNEEIKNKSPIDYIKQYKILIFVIIAVIILITIIYIVFTYKPIQDFLKTEDLISMTQNRINNNPVTIDTDKNETRYYNTDEPPQQVNMSENIESDNQKYETQNSTILEQHDEVPQLINNKFDTNQVLVNEQMVNNSTIESVNIIDYDINNDVDTNKDNTQLP